MKTYVHVDRKNQKMLGFNESKFKFYISIDLDLNKQHNILLSEKLDIEH